ncbi:MAG: hypothetical protein QM503_04045, partial [Bacteroidota bacterium]
MKKVILIAISLFMVFNFSNCGSKDDTTPEEENETYDVLFYEPTYVGKDYKSDQLQATIKKSDLQFSTFGDVNTGEILGNFNKAYVYNSVENTEAFILFDDLGEPAFIYKVNLVTGKKDESVVEFKRVDQNNFYVRFFYYDWQNRLGTLLFETMITKNGDDYQSNPTYTIENLDFGGKSTRPVSKTNTSFPIKLSRLDQLMSPISYQSQTKSTNGGMDDWMASFNEMKNSSISDWLSKTRKAGVVLTLSGLGLSQTVIGAPVGVWLVAGGSGVIVVSTAIEVVITDKWSNFLNETQSKIETLTESVTEIAGNVVQKFEGYEYDLKEHWVNNNIPKTELEDLTTSIEEDEIIVGKDDLNDLPDKDGVLQIGLSWNTNETDIDLWVTDPAGELLYYGNPTSASGGYLDRDDTDGYGPENIYWVSNIPDGDYFIQVHYYSGEPVTNYEVKVT